MVPTSTKSISHRVWVWKRGKRSVMKRHSADFCSGPMQKTPMSFVSTFRIARFLSCILDHWLGCQTCRWAWWAALWSTSDKVCKRMKHFPKGSVKRTKKSNYFPHRHSQSFKVSIKKKHLGTETTICSSRDVWSWNLLAWSVKIQLLCWGVVSSAVTVPFRAILSASPIGDDGVHGRTVLLIHLALSRHCEERRLRRLRDPSNAGDTMHLSSWRSALMMLDLYSWSKRRNKIRVDFDKTIEFNPLHSKYHLTYIINIQIHINIHKYLKNICNIWEYSDLSWPISLHSFGNWASLTFHRLAVQPLQSSWHSPSPRPCGALVSSNFNLDKHRNRKFKQI